MWKSLAKGTQENNGWCDCKRPSASATRSFWLKFLSSLHLARAQTVCKMDQLVETVVRPVKQTRQVIAPATVAPVEKPAATETVAQGNSSARRERSRSPARGKPEEECDGEAHCFYNCVAAGYALQFEGKDRTTVQPQVSSRGRGLREQIATHIQKHAKDYRHWRPAEDLGNNAVQIEDGDTAWVPLKITSLLCFGQNVGPTNWLGEQLLVALEFDIAAIHDPSKCDQIVSYGNPNASVQITLAFEGGHYKLVDPNPDVKLPEKGSNMVAEAEEGYGMAAPRGGAKSQVSSPARKSWIPSSAAKTWIPRSTPARTKQAASKAGTRVAAHSVLSAAFAKSQQGTAISRNYSASAVALDLSLAPAAKALRPCKVNSGLFTGCAMFATRRFQAPLSDTFQSFVQGT